MIEAINKLQTYLGFAIKSNSVIFGYDNILKNKKRIYLIVFCSTASEKMFDKLKTNCQKLKLKDVKLSDLLNRENVKVVAIKNFDLAKAILNYNNVFET